MKLRTSSYSILLRRLFWERIFFDKCLYPFQGYKELKDKADIFSQSRTLWFFAGELFYEFYNDPQIIDALSKALDNGAKMQFIFGPALYVNNAEFLNMVLNNKNVDLYKRSISDESHFKIIERLDDEILAISDVKHDVNVESENRRSLLLIKGFAKEIRELTDKFVLERKKAKRITRDNIIEEFSDQTINEKGDLCGFIIRVNGVARHATEDQVASLAKELGLDDSFTAVKRIKCNHFQEPAPS